MFILDKKDNFMILVVYVDDIIVAVKNKDLFNKFKVFLSSKFDIKDLGKIRYCLGVEFNQDPDTKSVFMSQKKYIENLLKKFGIQDANSVQTPLDHNTKLNKSMMPVNKSDIEEMSKVPYQQLIGSLM